MSKYDNYGQFMIAVINDADQKSINLGSRLKNYLHVSDDTVMQIVTAILGVGWAAFVAVCGLLLLGPVAFVVALATFVAGGIGAVVVAALAIYGGVQAIKLLYSNKAAPLRISEIGKNYRGRFNDHKGETAYIDSLINQASNELLGW